MWPVTQQAKKKKKKKGAFNVGARFMPVVWIRTRRASGVGGKNGHQGGEGANHSLFRSSSRIVFFSPSLSLASPLQESSGNDTPDPELISGRKALPSWGIIDGKGGHFLFGISTVNYG